MKKFIFLQIIIAVLIHFTADAKQFAEPGQKRTGFELQCHENDEEDCAIILEHHDFNGYCIITKFISPSINKSNYRIHILKPPQNLLDSLHKF